ncbi:CPBP family intramembrane glutamic endopeptidase [Apilactobacillus micheneri]|uniref:CPBP family intramembrane glutamic endopeptidase n=1 Tax=Apilactobacillus micheneri TaxID=1899430 RepID=UPI000D0286CE|nr:type II CAAX endopeptidase family protein [Apilactobacillus micheneri]
MTKNIGKYLLCFLFIILSPLLGIIYYPLHDSSDNHLYNLLINEIIVFFIILLIIYAIYKSLLKKDFIKLFKIRFDKKMTPLLTILIIFLSVSHLVITSKLPDTTFINKMYIATGNHFCSIFFVTLVVRIVLGPFLEELLFRGIIYSYMKNFTNIYSTILISSIGFGIAHSLFSIDIILYNFLTAVLLGIARENSKGIVFPFILHALSNLSVFFIFLVF